jgi:Xaa-Pro aminopeptidase
MKTGKKMSNGIGGKTQQQALAELSNMTSDLTPIQLHEYQARIEKAQLYMRNNNIGALYLNAGTNLTYFTGMQWYPSERLVGALLPAEGDVVYLAPAFEIDSLKERQVVDGEIKGWHEHESPYALFVDELNSLSLSGSTKIAIDESTPFFIVDGINTLLDSTWSVINGAEVSAHCRMHKSDNELALIQRAMDMTLEVHKAAASILCEGITT